MTSVLKVKTAYPLKFEGKQYKANDDITNVWNPGQMNHLQMFLYKQVLLVKEELPEEGPEVKTVTKRAASTTKK